MGPQEDKSLTESGVKYVYQYMILFFCLNICILFYAIFLYLSGDNLQLISSGLFFFAVLIIVVTILVYLWPIRGLVDFYNGRKEFGQKHESNVITGTILLIAYFVLSIFGLVMAGGFVGGIYFISVASGGFDQILINFIIISCLAVVSKIILGLALVYFILEILNEKQKKKLWITFGLMVASYFTIEITGLISNILFFTCYRDAYYRLHEGNLKPATNAPCPYCDKDIPINSLICPYCGKKFEKEADIEVDPRLTMEIPKSRYAPPKGYTPVEGPTEIEKKHLKLIIILVVVIIAIIAASLLLVTNLNLFGASKNTNDFIGTWTGGEYDGTNYLTTDEDWAFYENNSLLKVNNSGSYWNTYSIDNNELCVTNSQGVLTCYSYNFSSSKSEYFLSLDNQFKYRFVKI